MKINKLLKRKKCINATVGQFERGFSVLEVILAAAIFVTFATAAVVVVISGIDNNRLGGEMTVANQFNAEGMEAVRSIKNQSYCNLENSAGTGVIKSGNVWTFSGTNNTLLHNAADNYIRTIKVEDAYRDGSGNIVSSGTVDPNTKKITSTTVWDFTAARPESISFTSYFTNWRRSISSGVHGGMLVYGDGGTTADTMKYRVFNTDGTWGSVTNFPDFDTSATNKALRAIRVYASEARNEKIALTRHFNGTQESIYAHIYDGNTWTSWQMASWTASAFDTANQGIRNFDGQYLNNGDFIFVYSDNTTTPKYRIWDGCRWSPNPPSTGSSVATIGGIPSNVTVRNREGSSEVMLAVFDQSSDTNTVYYSGSAWLGLTEHATNAPTNRKEFAEFAWSTQDPLQGALIYQTSSSDRAMNLKIWTANGSGGGSWGGTNVNTTSQGTLGAMELDGGRKGAEEFLACDKDANNDIYCFRGNTTPAWASPTNNLMTATTDTGIQRSFDLAYKGSTGTEGIVVYSDTTAVPKLKRYVASSNSFLTTVTSLNNLGAALKTVKLRSIPDNDDIMIMLGNANNDFFTVVWNGSVNSVYTTPSGKAFATQGTNGSNAIELWYGFAWDRF